MSWYAAEACAAATCDGSPMGILGARIIGAPAGVGDRNCGIAVIPARGDVMNRAASVKHETQEINLISASP